jgi:hypothetical protein
MCNDAEGIFRAGPSACIPNNCISVGYLECHHWNYNDFAIQYVKHDNIMERMRAPRVN